MSFLNLLGRNLAYEDLRSRLRVNHEFAPAVRMVDDQAPREGQAQSLLSSFWLFVGASQLRESV